MQQVTVLEQGEIFLTLRDGMPRFWQINEDGHPVMLSYALTGAGRDHQNGSQE